jgi:hypothetical protein
MVLTSLVAVGGAQACSAQEAPRAIRELVERQAHAWETQNIKLAAGDWLPTAVLSSPEGNTPTPELGKSMDDYFKGFKDLHVTIKNIFASPDGTKVAIEWDWAIIRKRDGKKGISHDAILVDLKGGKIASWREYYDPAASGEATP